MRGILRCRAAEPLLPSMRSKHFFSLSTLFAARRCHTLSDREFLELYGRPRSVDGPAAEEEEEEEVMRRFQQRAAATSTTTTATSNNSVHAAAASALPPSSPSSPPDLGKSASDGLSAAQKRQRETAPAAETVASAFDDLAAAAYVAPELPPDPALAYAAVRAAREWAEWPTNRGRRERERIVRQLVDLHGKLTASHDTSSARNEGETPSVKDESRHQYKGGGNSSNHHDENEHFGNATDDDEIAGAETSKNAGDDKPRTPELPQLVVSLDMCVPLCLLGAYAETAKIFSDVLPHFHALPLTVPAVFVSAASATACLLVALAEDPTSLKIPSSEVATVVTNLLRSSREAVRHAKALVSPHTTAGSSRPFSAEVPSPPPTHTDVVHATEVLCWAADYLSHAAPRLSIHFDKSLAPHWIAPHIMNRESGGRIGGAATLRDGRVNKDEMATDALHWRSSACPPSALLRAAGIPLFSADSAAAANAADSNTGRTLWPLYNHCVEREAAVPLLGIFRLSPRVGAALLSSSSSADAASPAQLQGVVRYLGASLPPQLLAVAAAGSGMGSGGRAAALELLGTMKGEEAYFAARSLTRGAPRAVTARLQDRYGDLLTGDATLTWRTALAAVAENTNPAAGVSDSPMLPTALRLLSDAGRHDDFYALLAQHNAQRRAAGENLVVASALAQVARRAGTWWHALEVLDLIACCGGGGAGAMVPAVTAQQRHFFEDACAQTMAALRDAGQWRAALEVYGALAPAMPPEAQRLMYGVVHRMPRDSPWAAALALLSSSHGKEGAIPPPSFFLPPSQRELPDDYVSRLAPEAGVTRRQAVKTCVERGCYRPLLRCAIMELLGRRATENGSKSQDRRAEAMMWESVLLAAINADAAQVVAQGDALASVPWRVLARPAMLSLAFKAARLNGWLPTLLRHLESGEAMKFAESNTGGDETREKAKSGTHAVTRAALEEWRQLLAFLVRGERPPKNCRATTVLRLTAYTTAVVAGKDVRLSFPASMFPDRASAVRTLQLPSAEPLKRRGDNYIYYHHSRADSGDGTQDADASCGENAGEAPLWSSPDGSVFVFYKPPGDSCTHAAARSLAAIMNAARDDRDAHTSDCNDDKKVSGNRCSGAYTLLYTLAAPDSGLVVAQRASVGLKMAASARVTVRMALTPLDGSAAAAAIPPLLAARFFREFSMSVLACETADGGVGPGALVAAEVCLDDGGGRDEAAAVQRSATGGLGARAPARRVELATNAEGWGRALGESEMTRVTLSGDAAEADTAVQDEWGMAAEEEEAESVSVGAEATVTRVVVQLTNTTEGPVTLTLPFED